MEIKKKYLLIVFIIGALLFLFHLGGRDLWEPDETRYAVVAREMMKSGNWILPSLEGDLYLEKPPLFFWLINLSTYLLGGNPEFSNRFPSALAGLITVLMTFILGSRLFNPRVGFISGLILATCFFFVQISRWMMLDSLFSLFFLLAIYYLYRGMNETARQRTWFLLSGVLMACATLTKGPIGYLPIPIFIIYSLLLKNIQKIWNRHLLYGVLLSVGIVLAWLLLAMGMAGQSYGIQGVWHQTIGRFAEGWKHRQAFYFYFVRFPLGFFPWIIFLPWTFAHGIHEMSTEKRKEWVLLFVWFVFVFLFFSFSKGKKDNYLLPLYPAAALLVGRWIGSFFEPGEEPRNTIGGLWIPIGLIMILFLTGGVILLLGPCIKWFPWGIEIYLSFAVWPLFLVAFGGILSFIFLLRKWDRGSVYCLISALIVAQVYVSMAIAPRFNPLRSMKPFSQQILLRMAPNDSLKIWKFQSTGLLYYTNRPMERIRTTNRLLELFQAPHRIFMVVEEEDFDKLKKKVKEISFHLVEKARVGHQTLWLVSNQPIR